MPRITTGSCSLLLESSVASCLGREDIPSPLFVPGTDGAEVEQQASALSSERVAGGAGVAVEHLDGVEGEVVEVLAERRELLE
jgi:hypothetical protein